MTLNPRTLAVAGFTIGLAAAPTFLADPPGPVRSLELEAAIGELVTGEGPLVVYPGPVLVVGTELTGPDAGQWGRVLCMAAHQAHEPGHPVHVVDAAGTSLAYADAGEPCVAAR